MPEHRARQGHKGAAFKRGLFLVLGLLVVTVLAQTTASLQIERPDRTIVVRSSAPNSEGGRFIPSNPNCEDNTTLAIFFAPNPYQVEMLVNDTRILSNIAFSRKPRGEGIEDASESLEMLPGTLEINERPFCPQNVQIEEAPNVKLLEGRSQIDGTAFNYDNATGIGIMSGPIALARAAEGDSAGLDATAGSLRFDVDNDLTILEGGVELTSEGRVSQAETAEFDEDAGIAILRGSPARSVDGDDVVEGDVIEYNVNSNDVVVRQNIKASFEFER